MATVNGRSERTFPEEKTICAEARHNTQTHFPFVLIPDPLPR